MCIELLGHFSGIPHSLRTVFSPVVYMLFFKEARESNMYSSLFHHITATLPPLRGGGGGGGGSSPDFCENTILRYELAMMARTCTNNLRVVLSP